MTTYDPVEFGERVRELRKSREMKQIELAEELHITRQHLSWLEAGGGCSLDILIEISLYFNVSADYLLFGIETGMQGMRERLLLVVEELTKITNLLQ